MQPLHLIACQTINWCDNDVAMFVSLETQMVSCVLICIAFICLEDTVSTDFVKNILILHEFKPLGKTGRSL